MRTVIFGGSFNPIHNGHVRLITAVYDAIRPERFLIVPANIPPHKQGEKMADPKDRLEMCRLTAEYIGNCEADGCEIERGGISYTVDTLRYYKKIYSDDELYLSMGGDMLFYFMKWREPEKILKMCSLVCVCRDPTGHENVLRAAEELKKFGGKCMIVDCKAYVCSSTDIRNKISLGESADGMLPPPVGEYIKRKGLYRDRSKDNGDAGIS